VNDLTRSTCSSHHLSVRIGGVHEMKEALRHIHAAIDRLRRAARGYLDLGGRAGQSHARHLWGVLGTSAASRFG
jgi:hypothetical protein